MDSEPSVFSAGVSWTTMAGTALKRLMAEYKRERTEADALTGLRTDLRYRIPGVSDVNPSESARFGAFTPLCKGFV